MRSKRVVDIVDPDVMKSYSNNKGRLFTRATAEIGRSFWDDVYKVITGKLSRTEFELNAKTRENELLK